MNCRSGSKCLLLTGAPASVSGGDTPGSGAGPAGTVSPALACCQVNRFTWALSPVKIGGRLVDMPDILPESQPLEPRTLVWPTLSVIQ